MASVSNAVLIPLGLVVAGYFLLRRRDWRPGRGEILLDGVGAARDPHVAVTRRMPGLLERRADPIGVKKNVVPPFISSGSRGW